MEVIKLTENQITLSRLDNLEKKYIILQHKLKVKTLVLVLFFGIFVISMLAYGMFDMQTEINSGPFVTQNLRGDVIDTWYYWNVLDGDNSFHIHVVNNAKIDENKIKIVYESILSNESIQIDDSLLHKGQKGEFSNFYLGWHGAINAASEIDTKYSFPKKFHVHESSSKDGDIVITLSKSKSSEGYAGYTRSLTDNNEILKSYVTVYQTATLTDNQLATILRHELGHAFGLIHTTDPNDLMHEKIITGIPYISECSIEALRELYDGKVVSEYTCIK